MPKHTIREIGYGQYQFVWPFQTPTDLDLVYVISGSGLGFADLSTIAVGGISVNDAIQPPVQTYPWTRYYFFTDPQLRTGLTPQFISAYRTDVLEPVTDMGAIVEVGNGVYKTSRVISNATSPDYAWVINTSGTALNPTAGLSDITLVEGFSSTVDVPGQTSEAFPATKVYVVGFNLEATGLTPTFTMLKRLDTLANESQPAITELNLGRYYFPWTFAAETDPESVYLISAGVGPSLKNIGGIAVNDVLTPIITPFQPSIVEAVLPPSAIASLGIDIDARGDLQFPMVLVGGFANLGQALTHRLMTPRGGLFYASDYGTDVRAYLNSSITQGQLVALAKKISKECEKDERVASCITTLTYNALNATMRITLVIQTAAGTYQYILGVNQISVAILQGQPIQQLAA
jgi:hypothetical protein